ncbi:acyl-CoA dehydrogenase family protein [Ottowia thiooxydans]|uniref:Alkylation response protein AidB-like acyl-CoA dehydrogenase n=1 Tax=Ottowia thiooxydans TaxID=219182 RepID=A0ABV2Q9M0_9BURK
MTETDTEIRMMLVDSARRWTERACTPELRSMTSEHATGCPPERWGELAELGWLGIAMPEADGGMGAGLPEQCLLAEQLGRALLTEPFVSNAVLGNSLMDAVAHGALRASWLPELASGERRVAWSAWEPDGAALLMHPSAKAKREGEFWRVSGAKGLMPGAGGADALLVTAQLAHDTTRTGLFLVETTATDMTLKNERLYDGRHAASVLMNNVKASLLQEASTEDLLQLLSQVLDRGLVAHCAETLGTAQAAFDITLDYVRTRRQFGRALGQNQIVQHRLVDLYVELQETRALCLEAAQAPQSRRVAALALRTGHVARHTWEEAIQLHGAIGMTDEYALGAYVRRLALAADLYGTSTDHSDRLANISLGAMA